MLVFLLPSFIALFIFLVHPLLPFSILLNYWRFFFFPFLFYHILPRFRSVIPLYHKLSYKRNQFTFHFVSHILPLLVHSLFMFPNPLWPKESVFVFRFLSFILSRFRPNILVFLSVRLIKESVYALRFLSFILPLSRNSYVCFLIYSLSKVFVCFFYVTTLSLFNLSFIPLPKKQLQEGIVLFVFPSPGKEKRGFKNKS